MRLHTGLLACLLVLAPESAETFERTEVRKPCSDFQKLRRPFFGDTHVHTALSFDASGQGTRATPRDAYRFALGEPIGIQPYDTDGVATQIVQLKRPLDYAIVTDHSDLLGETRMCQTPGGPGYDSWTCILVRRWPRLAYALINSRYGMENPTRMSFCGPEARDCLQAAEGPWREIQEAAEEFYDRSASCHFTTFVGYEWTAMPGMSNIHRNVIFRNERTQSAPTTFIETPSAIGLWADLDASCTNRNDGCEVIAIPHNSNVSKGRMFRIEDDSGDPIDQELAKQRARLETLVEITQHKGDSECRVEGSTRDELCAYEKLPYAGMDGEGLPTATEPLPPRIFTREVLAEGLVQKIRLGVNPFRFGVIGATDTHFGTPGMVAEDEFVGHAAGTVSRRMKVPPLPDSPRYNPGGLGVLWAEENSRDALFAAMRRREAYGTSGPRIVARFFGGWDYPAGVCDSATMVADGYGAGVPMGGELGPRNAGQAPRFIAAAWQDPGTSEAPGNRLDRLQIIKAWVEDGKARERVYDVGRAAGPAGTVDLDTCAVDGGGASSLCSLWEDLEFDANQHALYYLRVIESPSCRWLQHACNARGVNCADASTITTGLEPCCDPGAKKIIHERAWTSPIWYTP